MDAKDIYTENGKIIFSENGDLQIKNSNRALASCLYYTSKGEFKNYPLSGLNIRSYINNNTDKLSRLVLENNIKSEFFNDGFQIQDIEVEYNSKINDYIIKTNLDRFR